MLTMIFTFLRPFLIPIAMVGIGFGSGVAFEHRGKQGFPLMVVGQSLKVQRDAARGDADFWEARARMWFAAYGDWKHADESCEATRKREAGEAAQRVNETYASAARDDHTAFNNGFSAGLRRGQQTCGAPDAPRPDPAVHTPAGGVRPDAEAGPDPLFGGDGAYRPGH